VFPGFELKENCFILEDNTIQPHAQIGANVTLWSGNHVGHQEQDLRERMRYAPLLPRVINYGKMVK
jgi:acyl-[acyl carrier protein]--UDP-N-acetylglucosamine O-acyltransferase